MERNLKQTSEEFRISNVWSRMDPETVDMCAHTTKLVNIGILDADSDWPAVTDSGLFLPLVCMLTTARFHQLTAISLKENLLPRV
jgi:hypothetical protein